MIWLSAFMTFSGIGLMAAGGWALREFARGATADPEVCGRKAHEMMGEAWRAREG